MYSEHYISPQLGGEKKNTPLAQSLFCNEVLNISRNLLNAIVIVKNRMVIWVHFHTIIKLED
jgi:hypothetical protein